MPNVAKCSGDKLLFAV